MRKKILIGVIFLLILMILAIVVICKDNSSDIVNEAYNKYLKDVDSGVSYLMQIEEFKEMDENSQIKEIKDLLKKYQNAMIIKNLHYDSTNKLYSFQYNYGELKGSLGGVSLKKWDPMMN